MKGLFSEWSQVADRIGQAGKALLCFDYDGTLTPIVARPEWAKLPPETSKLLAEVAHRPDYPTAVISGRSLADVRNLVGLDSIIYAGNHGLELEGPRLHYLNPQAEAARPVLEDIAGRIRKELAGVEGLQIEDKKLSLSIHFRRVSGKNLDNLFRMVEKITRKGQKDGLIRVTAGKKVIEIRPPVQWDKGKIVSWLWEKLAGDIPGGEIIPLYVGDDQTDEDAFRAIGGGGITVRVGSPEIQSRAQYYLEDTNRVKELLKKLLQIP